MRILFINHTFPGIFGPLAAAFAAKPGNEVLFLSSCTRRHFSLPAVKHIVLSPVRERRAGKEKPALQELDRILRSSRQALRAFELLIRNNLIPDMVLLNAAWDYWMHGPASFPNAFTVCYPEPFIPIQDDDAALRGDLIRTLFQYRQMVESDLCISLTAGEPGPWADRLANAVELPCPVDTDFFSPAKAEPVFHEGVPLGGRRKTVLFEITGAEASSDLIRAAISLVGIRSDCHAVLLCRDDTQRQLLRENLARLSVPDKRLLVPRSLSLRVYRNLLTTSAALVFGSSPRPSTLLEAMSCGTVPVLPPSFFPHGRSRLRQDQNMVQCREASPDALAVLLDSLMNSARLESLGLNARQTVLASFQQKNVIPRHVDRLTTAWQHWKEQR